MGSEAGRSSLRTSLPGSPRPDPASSRHLTSIPAVMRLSVPELISHCLRCSAGEVPWHASSPARVPTPPMPGWPGLPHTCSCSLSMGTSDLHLTRLNCFMGSDSGVNFPWGEGAGLQQQAPML